MQLQDILTRERVASSLPATSKKRLLERLSQLLAQGAPQIDAQVVFQCLIERERLGSTGIGEGVALPHGRMPGLKKALGAFAVLEKDMDYDAVDRKPVRLVFALLVPEEATTEHLQLLSQLAGIFSDKATRDMLLQAKTVDELYNGIVRSNTA